MATKTKIKNLLVRLPEPLHARLQKRAQKDNRSMSQYVVNAVDKAVQADTLAEDTYKKVDAGHLSETHGMVKALHQDLLRRKKAEQ